MCLAVNLKLKEKGEKLSFCTASSAKTHSVSVGLSQSASAPQLLGREEPISGGPTFHRDSTRQLQKCSLLSIHGPTANSPQTHPLLMCIQEACLWGKEMAQTPCRQSKNWVKVAFCSCLRLLAFISFEVMRQFKQEGLLKHFHAKLRPEEPKKRISERLTLPSC